MHRNQLPPPIYIPAPEHEAERMEMLEAVFDRPVAQSLEAIHAVLTSKDSNPMNLFAVGVAATRAEKTPVDFVASSAKEVAAAYLAHRTDDVLRPIYDDKLGGIKAKDFSNKFEELSNMLGEHSAREILRSLTFHIDTALEERYEAGRSL